MAKAEQRRNDQGFYSLANGDEDGSIEIRFIKNYKLYKKISYIFQ